MGLMQKKNAEQTTSGRLYMNGIDLTVKADAGESFADRQSPRLGLL